MSSSLLLGAAQLLPSGPHDAGLHLLVGYDMGDAQVATSAVEALLLDGERVRRTHVGNRTFTLPVVVIGSTRADLTARVDALLTAVAADTFTLTWTPSGGLPLVFDCFPAQPTVAWDVQIQDVKFAQQINLVIPALPYGRSSAATTPTVTLAQTVGLGKRYTLSGLVGSARAPLSAVLGFASATDAWLLHRPPIDADPAAPIITALTSGAATISGAERLRGTYSVVLGMSTYGTPGEDRVVTVTVGQAGTSVTQQISKAYVSSLNLRHLVVGNITLPLVDRPAGAATSLTVTVDDSGDSAFLSVMLLDTRGQTVQALSQADGTGASVKAWIDAPDPGAAIGPIWSSSTTTRTDAYALTEPRVSGGAMSLSAADEGGSLLVFSATAAPSTPALTYYPRWLAERVT